MSIKSNGGVSNRLEYNTITRYTYKRCHGNTKNRGIKTVIAKIVATKPCITLYFIYIKSIIKIVINIKMYNLNTQNMSNSIIIVKVKKSR